MSTPIGALQDLTHNLCRQFRLYSCELLRERMRAHFRGSIRGSNLAFASSVPLLVEGWNACLCYSCTRSAAKAAFPGNAKDALICNSLFGVNWRLHGSDRHAGNILIMFEFRATCV